MKKHVNCLTLLIVLAAGSSCSRDEGLDSISKHKPYEPQSITSECLKCHVSSNSPSLDPLVSNGTGTSGKHVRHAGNKGIACEVCHLNYGSAKNHMDGVLDTVNTEVDLVAFGSLNPAGAWINDTGTQTGSCSAVSCHGADTLDWYGTAGWTSPSNCAFCHTGALDPVALNGQGVNGKHVKHVSSRNISCDECHLDYSSSAAHMNGLLDTIDPSVHLIGFDSPNQSGQWINDTGPQTGGCSSLTCHGTDVPNWYGTETWATPGCANCHTGFLNPLTTNGSGTAGKHVKHVTDRGISCDECHRNYSDRGSHMNGSIDTADSSVLAVYFDSTNPGGQWINDTGAKTGSCNALDCHGADTLAWYGTTPWTLPPCSDCHSSAMGARRQVSGSQGDFATNSTITSHHVAGVSDPTEETCKVCHSLSMHTSGIVLLRNADTAGLITFDSTSTATLEPFCLSCHDSDAASLVHVSGGTPASPFNDGKALGSTPYTMSVEIKTAWTKSFGHKQKGLTCIGDGSPDTGCHSNGHGSAIVGLLGRNMKLPLIPADVYAEGDYQLCFDCHSSYSDVTKEAVLGVSSSGTYSGDYGPGFNPPPYDISAIKTKFRDQNNRGTGEAYDDPSNFWLSGEDFVIHDSVNLHWFHIAFDAWYYRGVTWSGMSCTACHSVHGTNSQYGMTYDEMAYQQITGTGADRYGMMGASDPYTLDQFPTSCAMNCHDSSAWGATHSWFDPANE